MTANFYTKKIAQNAAILAPMAGFTDAPFRKLCRYYGSAWAVTEMVSAKALVLGDQKGIEIGEPYVGEPDLVIQVFGGESEIVAEAGQMLVERYQPKALDLNMGCPVKKITGKSCGSKLMQDPERAAQIISALSKAVNVPVSAKMRLGFEEQNVIEVAQALESAGASLIAVHGRTATQKYTGVANWDAIAEVASSVNIPVVGSGDVANREAFEHYRALGLGVMIARAAMGQPWIFAELAGMPKPSSRERYRLAYYHLLLHLNWYGANTQERETHLIRKFRGQLLKYFEAIIGARELLLKLETLSEIKTFLLEYCALDVSTLKTDELKRF